MSYVPGEFAQQQQRLDFSYVGKDTVSPISSLDALIQEFHNIFQADCVNVEYVYSIMSQYKSEPRDWKKFAKFDRFQYTRNLVDSGNGKFNVMLLCWSEGLGSTIHNHEKAHCFMKVLQGEIQETRYGWPKIQDEDMFKLSEGTLHLNEVTYINDSLGLHRVTNPSHVDTAVTLHLYVPPYDSCLVFDERTGYSKTSPVTFYSIFGQKK